MSLVRDLLDAIGHRQQWILLLGDGAHRMGLMHRILSSRLAMFARGARCRMLDALTSSHPHGRRRET